jgi:uncharacterized protein
MKLLVPALAALLLAAPAMAQPAPAPAPPAATDLDARLDTARRLMEVTDEMGMLRQIMGALEAQLIQRIATANPGKEDLVRRLVSDLIMPEFRARVGELVQPTLRIYAGSFTQAEMEELMAFYATPIGRKVLAVTPQITQQSTALGLAWGQRITRDAIAKHERAIRERGIRL